MTRKVLNQDRVDHDPGALTTRPRCRLNSASSEREPKLQPDCNILSFLNLRVNQNKHFDSCFIFKAANIIPRKMSS